MKRTDWCRQFGSIHHLTARGGFTLVEVLVVMAIMVVLFGMLFVPISSSIDMARAGQTRVQMQQQLQMAMQRVNRGLATARYIYLPEYIQLAGADGTPLTADDTYLINYSNITFQPQGFSGSAAVRYAVMTPAYTIEEIPAGSGFWYCVPTAPELDNPWILYRMEGRMEPVGGRNVFGADYDADGDGTYDYFVIGLWSSRNALTPGRNADIPVTRTICLDANGYLVLPPSPPAEPGQLWAKGYVAFGDLDDNGTNDIEEAFGSNGVMLVYIHDGVKFGPLRVENERLADDRSGDTTTFSAEYGHWLGLPNPVVTGPYSIGEAIWGPVGPMLINSSELRPRIVVRRWDDPTHEVMLDTDALDPADPIPAPNNSPGYVVDNMFGTSWNSAQGTVTVATAAGPARIDFNFGVIPDDYQPWAALLTDASGGTVTGYNEVYTEPIRETTLTLAYTPWGGGPIPFPMPPGLIELHVVDASPFRVGETIRIVDASDPEPLANRRTATIAAIDTTNNIITMQSFLGRAFNIGDWVQAPNDAKYRKAPSSYGITPWLEVAIADKMVVPDSVRVRVNATGTSGTASKEYRRVASAQDDIGPGQFAIEPVAPGDYRTIAIHFGNGEEGANGVRTPPPSPDDPSTFGGTSIGWDVNLGELNAFWIEISYNVRRNFSTATPALRNDQIDVSYSTRAVYNVSLELLPWRYYEDNDSDHIWTPYQRTKGVDLQAHIPIAALGG